MVISRGDVAANFHTKIYLVLIDKAFINFLERIPKKVLKISARILKEMLLG
jgi:hypothetical protein